MRIDVAGGQVSVEVRGEGPLVLCAPGMLDVAMSYRALSGRLVDAGYRVAVMDLRGHGESDVTFDRYDPEAVGADMLAVIAQLGGPAVLVANSAAAASAVWASAETPSAVSGLVLLGPVARDSAAFRPWMQTLVRWIFAGPWGPWLWTVAHRSLFKGGAPADHADHAAMLRACLSQPGRMAAGLQNGTSSKAPCTARLGQVRAPALVVMGAADPDFPDATAEAVWLGAQLGCEPEILPGVGHYPHLERAEHTAALVQRFLGSL